MVFFTVEKRTLIHPLQGYVSRVATWSLALSYSIEMQVKLYDLKVMRYMRLTVARIDR